MDINEKEIPETGSEPEEVTENCEAEEACEACENGEACKADEPENYTTLDVTAEDINEELQQYGIDSTEENGTVDTEENANSTAVNKKKLPIQTPIIIGAVALALVAVIVFGGISLYKAIFRSPVVGTYVMAEDTDASVYFIFDKDGNVSMTDGGTTYFGTYTTEKNDKGVEILKSDFYILSYYGGEAEVKKEKDILTLTFEAGEINLAEKKMPELDIKPEEITHASADELGITSLNIDEAIIGSWSEETYGTYTFNKDGTGTCVIDYQYSEYYGMGYGIESKFKYTIYEDQVLVSLPNFTGTANDGSFEYYLDGDNLVIGGIGYKAVK
ncbi:MAG: DUF5640 domain-containing protein [Ruminococcus sp.]